MVGESYATKIIEPTFEQCLKVSNFFWNSSLFRCSYFS